MKRYSLIRWLSLICMIVFSLGSFLPAQAVGEEAPEQIRLNLSGSAEIPVQELVIESRKFISLGVDAEGNNLHWQWQYLPEGGKDWIDWPGRTTSTLYEMAEDRMDSWKIRCKVTGAGKNEVTEAVNLKVTPTLLYVIVSEPNGSVSTATLVNGYLKGNEGDLYSISLKCSENDMSYQWCYGDKYNGNDWTNLPGETGSSIQFKLDPALNGKYLNCIIKDKKGDVLSIRDYCLTNSSWHIEVMSKKTTSEMTIYAASSDRLAYISIPEDYPTFIDVAGKTCTVISGESAKAEDGHIVPETTSTVSWSTGTISENPNFGDTVFQLDGKETLLVHVVDYAQIYAEGVMDSYLAKNITADMTERKKAELCCEFVCSFDYSPDASGYTGMIVKGGGDCWASTSTLLYMFEKLGIQAEMHDSRGSGPNTLSGHINVSAKLDGKYCIAEAGYEGKAPRFYSIVEYQSMFAYTVLEDGKSIAITALNNVDQAESITVPSKIDGYTVKKLDDGAFRSHKEVTAIKLPDTLEEIGEYAFSVCGIRTITIPAAVKAISGNSFSQCDNLERIEVAAGGSNFSGKDGILYDNSGKRLICCPTAHKGDVEIPEGTEEIETAAFFCTFIGTLKLPGTLKKIGTGAFAGAWIQNVIFADGIESIPEACLVRASRIDVVSIPQSVKTIGKEAFAGASLQAVTLPENLETIGESAFAETAVNRVQIPASVRVIEGNAFGLKKGDNNKAIVTFSSESDHIALGQDVFSGTVLGVYEGSQMHEYAKKNNVPFILLDTNGRALLQKAWFNTDISNCWYTGEAIQPSMKVMEKELPFTLEEGRDYEIKWGENIEPGIGTVTAEGRGFFTGSVTAKFEIEASQWDKIRLFVARCYKVILGRDPEESGLNGWSLGLSSGLANASQIIDGIVSSEEYALRHFSNEASVKVLYQAMLGREPDADGLAAWTDVLNQGYPFGSVINGFCGSAEFISICNEYGILPGSVNVGPVNSQPGNETPRGKIEAFVRRCYKLILSRDADEGGLKGWSDALETRTAAAAQIIDGFVRSEEYSNRNLAAGESVDILYKTMLDRDADEGGRAGWVYALGQGYTLQHIINGFCGSAEFTAICDNYGIVAGSVAVSGTMVKREAISPEGDEAEAPVVYQGYNSEFINEEKIRAFVEHCYVAVFGREGDTEGVENYTKLILDGKKSPKKVAYEFIFSPEFQNQLPGNEDFIRILYRLYFDREPGAEELAGWVQMLEGGASLEEIVNGFAGSDEFKAIVNEMKD